MLLLVGSSRQDISDRNWQVGDLAAELLLDHGVVVSPLVENREYFNRNLRLFPFYRSIEHEGVRIVPDIKKADLSRYRFRKAEEILAFARRDMEVKDYTSAWFPIPR